MKKVRQSNIEILRITAMFMILLFHANFYSLGIPTHDELLYDTGSSIVRMLFESFCAGAVNIFVLISGWFGIRANVKGFVSFLFQCFFIIAFVCVIYFVLGGGVTIKDSIKACLMLTGDMWFIKAYIGLYILSPFLNAFIDKASNKQLIGFLAVFYAFTFLYGWIIQAATFIESGYSTFSFIGLYVLARTCKRNESKLKQIRPTWYLLSYLLIIVANTVFATFGIYKNTLGLAFFSYTSPTVIISSMLLVIWFSTLKIQSSAINWIAKSSLAVYLIHMHVFVKGFYSSSISFIYDNNVHGQAFLLIFLFCVCVFLVSIIADKFRIITWNGLLRMAEKFRK